MPKLNLPGLNRKKPSPEDLNFQCIDDGSVISEDAHGLGDLLEKQNQPDKKTSSSSISVFQRLKTLGGRGKKKSDDTVITCFGNNGTLDEDEEEDSSSSSSSSDEVYQYGRTKLPDTLVDLGDDSSSADEDDSFQYIPKGPTKALGSTSVMPASGGLKRPSLLTAPSGMNLTTGLPPNKDEDSSCPLRFMDSAPSKSMSGAASVMPSSSGSKLSRPSLLAAPSGKNFEAETRAKPSLLAAPSGRNMFADLSPRGNKNTVGQLTSTLAEEADFESSNVPLSSSDEPALPRPRLLPAPSGRGEMLEHVSPTRAPRPKAQLSELPSPDDDKTELRQQTQQRQRPRRRADGSLRGNGGSVCVPPSAEKPTRRRQANRSNNPSSKEDVETDAVGRRRGTSRSNDHNNNSSTLLHSSNSEMSGVKEEDEDEKPCQDQTQSQVSNLLHGSNRDMPGIEEGDEDPETANESPNDAVVASPLPASPKQKSRKNMRIPKPEDDPTTPSGNKASSPGVQSPTKEKSRRRLKPSHSADTAEMVPPLSPGQKSRRRVPLQATGAISDRPIPPSPRTPSRRHREADNTEETPRTRKQSPVKHPKSHSSPKPASPKKNGGKPKIAAGSPLMDILQAAVPVDPHKKPKESESVASNGGFMMAPPTKSRRQQMMRAPSCSNFQMDAPPTKGASRSKPPRPSGNALGSHLGGEDGPQVHKRSSATVTGAAHDDHDLSKRFDRRSKPRDKKRSGAASVAPMSSQLIPEKISNGVKGTPEEEEEEEETVAKKGINFSNDIENLVKEENDTEEMRELMGFLSASQHARRRVSMSDIPSTHKTNEGAKTEEDLPAGSGSKRRSHSGVRRHSLSSANEEERQAQSGTAPEGIESLFDKKLPGASSAKKKRDAQSVIVGRTPNMHSKARPMSKTSDDLVLKGNEGNTSARAGIQGTQSESFSKQDILTDGQDLHSSMKRSSASIPYGKKSLFENGEHIMKEEDEVLHADDKKKSPVETSREKTGERHGNRPEGTRRPRALQGKRSTGGRRTPDPEGSRQTQSPGDDANEDTKPSQPRRGHPPAKSSRARNGNPRRPGDRKPHHRGSPTSVINGANGGTTPARESGKRRNSLDSKIRTEATHRTVPGRSKSDDLVSLSSNHDEIGEASVAAQLSFLPDEGNNGNIGVKYDDVVSVLGESWRRM